MKNFYKKLSFVMVMGISLSSYAAWNGDATAWTQGDGSEQGTTVAFAANGDSR